MALNRLTVINLLPRSEPREFYPGQLTYCDVGYANYNAAPSPDSPINVLHSPITSYVFGLRLAKMLQPNLVPIFTNSASLPLSSLD